MFLVDAPDPAKARRLHFLTVNQYGGENALQPKLQRLLMLALPPLSFALVLDISSMPSDCTLPLLLVTVRGSQTVNRPTSSVPMQM
jgi:hypothetical protein